MTTSSAAGRVSVLTPSFNQARFLAQNLASVRAQGPVVREHIVMDGGSSDGSAALLESTGPADAPAGGAFVRWRSEPDGGQGAALNKALALAGGDILGWVNSDDLYCPGAAAAAVAALDADPALVMVVGHCDRIDAGGRVLGRIDAYDVGLEELLAFATIPQPACFVRRAAVQAVGGVDQRLRYAMDYDLWLRLALDGARCRAVDQTWAQFREHAGSKTVAEAAGRFLPEIEHAMEAVLASPRLPPALAGQRKALRRRFHATVARGAYGSLDLRLARMHSALALSADPLGMDRATAWVAMRSLLPPGLITVGRNFKRRLGLLRGGPASTEERPK